MSLVEAKTVGGRLKSDLEYQWLALSGVSAPAAG